MGKIVPGNFDAGNSGESTYLGGEPMDDNQRIEGVETNLQKTREAMIAGFGDVKEAIAKPKRPSSRKSVKSKRQPQVRLAEPRSQPCGKLAVQRNPRLTRRSLLWGLWLG